MTSVRCNFVFKFQFWFQNYFVVFLGFIHRKKDLNTKAQVKLRK